MLPFYETIAVIPVGPNTDLDFLRDTIESFIYYTSSSYKILLSDDSRQGIGGAMQKIFSHIDVLTTKKPLGSMAGLYITLGNAYQYALNHYNFKVLFKLDTDALVIGPSPEKDAITFFEEYPGMAIAGQYPLDYQGKPWDVGWPRARIINGTMTWKFIRRPVANTILRGLYLRALKNGYKTGESVFGGAYYLNRTFLETLQHKKMLPDVRLQTLNMGEDHLFGLMAKSLGMELGNLSGKDLPFGCAWKGLPVSPEQLLKDKKKIIHSTRHWKDMGEAQIRSYFRDKRRHMAFAPDQLQSSVTSL